MTNPLTNDPNQDKLVTELKMSSSSQNINPGYTTVKGSLRGTTNEPKSMTTENKKNHILFPELVV